eukprot:78783-Rhodomonas_salina.1
MRATAHTLSLLLCVLPLLLSLALPSSPPLSTLTPSPFSNPLPLPTPSPPPPTHNSPAAATSTSIIPPAVAAVSIPAAVTVVPAPAIVVTSTSTPTPTIIEPSAIVTPSSTPAPVLEPSAPSAPAVLVVAAAAAAVSAVKTTWRGAVASALRASYPGRESRLGPCPVRRPCVHRHLLLSCPAPLGAPARIVQCHSLRPRHGQGRHGAVA